MKRTDLSKSSRQHSLIQRCHKCDHITESKLEIVKCPKCHHKFPSWSAIFGQNKNIVDLLEPVDTLSEEDLVKGIQVLW